MSDSAARSIRLGLSRKRVDRFVLLQMECVRCTGQSTPGRAQECSINIHSSSPRKTAFCRRLLRNHRRHDRLMSPPQEIPSLSRRQDVLLWLKEPQASSALDLLYFSHQRRACLPRTNKITVLATVMRVLERKSRRRKRHGHRNDVRPVVARMKEIGCLRERARSLRRARPQLHALRDDL